MHRHFTHYHGPMGCIRAVASLGLVSPGATTEGVTPIFLFKNWRPFLVISVCLSVLQCHPYLFAPENRRPFCSSLSLLLISLRCHLPPPPEGIIPHHFYMFHLVSPLFFVNSPTNFCSFGCYPWRVLPGAVRLPLSDATAYQAWSQSSAWKVF